MFSISCGDAHKKVKKMGHRNICMLTQDDRISLAVLVFLKPYSVRIKQDACAPRGPVQALRMREGPARTLLNKRSTKWRFWPFGQPISHFRNRIKEFKITQDNICCYQDVLDRMLRGASNIFCFRIAKNSLVRIRNPSAV